MIPEMREYRSKLKNLVCEKGRLDAKQNLLDILKYVHNRDLLRKGGLILDFLNGVKISMDEDDQ